MSSINVQNPPATADRHIATIVAELHIGDQVIHPAQVSYDQIILADAVEIKAGPGRLTVSIDGAVLASDIEILPHSFGTLDIPIRLIR